MNSSVRAALILGTTVWCLAIVAAPFFHLTPIYLIFSAVCHQLPTRSWHIHGEPLAACIRCTAIYYGFLAGLLTLSKPRARWFKVAVAITAAEWLLAFALFDSEVLRTLSGLLLGASAAPIVRIGVEEMSGCECKPAQSVSALARILRRRAQPSRNVRQESEDCA